MILILTGWIINLRSVLQPDHLSQENEAIKLEKLSQDWISAMDQMKKDLDIINNFTETISTTTAITNEQLFVFSKNQGEIATTVIEELKEKLETAVEQTIED
jgi:hypothetical protein